MVDRGHVFRRAFAWLPSQFASQSDAPVGAPRQFGSTEHLSTEAMAAYVPHDAPAGWEDDGLDRVFGGDGR